MASVYLTNTAGDGLTTQTCFRPSGFDAVTWAVLMVDPVKGKTLVVSPDDSIVAAGVIKLATAVDVRTLIRASKTTNVPVGMRTTVNTWLSNNGYNPVPSNLTTWWDALHFIARQVNPSANLDILVI